MKSPLVIIFELLSGLISNSIETMGFVAGKLVELFFSLMFVSSLGVFGFLTAVAIGAAVFVFVSKTVFKEWGSVVSLCIAALAVVIVLAILNSV